MGSGAFLVAACRYLAGALERARGERRQPLGCGRPTRSPRRASSSRGAAMSLRRGPEPDGGAARAPVAVAHDARPRSPAHLSRSPPRGRRQPARRGPRSIDAAAILQWKSEPGSHTRAAALCGRLVGADAHDDPSRSISPRVGPRRHAGRCEREGTRPGRTRRARSAAGALEVCRRHLVCRLVPRRRAGLASGILRPRPRAARRRRVASAPSARGTCGRRPRRGAACIASSIGSSSSPRSSSMPRAVAILRGGFDAVIGNPPWDALRADSGDDELTAAGASGSRERVCGSSVHRASSGIRARDMRIGIGCSSNARCTSCGREAAWRWSCRRA